MSEPALSFGQKLRYGAEAAAFFLFMGLFRLLAWTPPRRWAA